MINKCNARVGSALLLVISMMVLMVTIATAFMSTMSRQRGTAVMLAARTRCEIGMEHATALIIKNLLEEYADPAVDYSWANGSTGSEWYVNCQPVGDADGDPWTEDGTPLSSGYGDAGNFVNVSGGVDVTDMMQRGTGDWRSEYYGIWTQYSGTRSRWHSLTFYDDFMQPIEIKDTLPEADKADLRRRSRYVLRYAMKTMDSEAQLGANNNYPHAPIIFNGSNAEDYNRYQSYLRRFGRSIKSMTGVSNYGSDALQYRANDGDFSDTRDPFDNEELSIFPDGKYMGKYVGLENDLRLRRESAFRREGMAWVESTNGLDQKSPHFMGGNALTTWFKIGAHNGGTGMNGAYYAPHFQFTPYAGNMLGVPLKNTDPDPCTVPWKVNYLTCAPQTLTAMYGGLSSHIKHGDAKGGKAKWANADLFGPGYPEPFPMGFEDGKDVHLIGMVNDNQIDTMKYAGYGTYNAFRGGALRTGDNNVITPAQGGNYKYYATANSYWADIHYAFELVRMRAEAAWLQKKKLTTSSSNSKNIENYYFVMRNPETDAQYSGEPGPSHIDFDETNPEIMTDQIIMETCRVLGEGTIKKHTATGPATSWNRYDNAKPSLLAGGKALVGLNLNWSGARPGKLCQLNQQANTRAMEYALNDALISLYGKANPYYVSVSDALENIAVDFNGDGKAESTVSGYYDSSTGEQMWSWWWDGLGAFGKPDNGDWMKQGAWMRFHDDAAGTIERKRGGTWVTLSGSERTEFLAVNDTFIRDDWVAASTSPIRPFSHTGRLFIGKSKMFQSFMRVEILNIPKRSVMAATHRCFVYVIDPNGDKSLEDSHVASQQEFDMKSTDL